jgi:hypothetical protein
LECSSKEVAFDADVDEVEVEVIIAMDEGVVPNSS